jgi:hypothetical protein
MEHQNYMIIKCLALIKARGKNDEVKQMKSLGKTGSDKMEAFIPNINRCG